MSDHRYILLSIVLWLALSAFGAACPQQQRHRASSDPPRVSLEEAQRLVYKALESEGAGATKLPGFGLSAYKDPYFPEFYFFEATWDNTGEGSVVIGHYAVDPRTGDVWDAVVCEELDSPSLRKLQQATRKRLGVTQKEYHKLRRPGPMCSPGETPLTRTTRANHT